MARVPVPASATSASRVFLSSESALPFPFPFPFFPTPEPPTLKCYLYLSDSRLTSLPQHGQAVAGLHVQQEQHGAPRTTALPGARQAVVRPGTGADRGDGAQRVGAVVLGCCGFRDRGEGGGNVGNSRGRQVGNNIGVALPISLRRIAAPLRP